MPAPDQTVAETPTPRTDAVYDELKEEVLVPSLLMDCARTLEREIAAANAALRDVPAIYYVDLVQIAAWKDRHAAAIERARKG